MILNEKALYDFLYCPLYFHTKHILHVPCPEKSPLNVCIIDTIKFFYSGLLNGQVKTYKQLQNKWDIFAKERELDEKQLIAGWGKIIHIVEWSKRNQIIVGDVNCKYTYCLNAYTVEGQIDFILVHKNHDIEILYFDLSDKRLNGLEEHHKIKYALDYFGFERLYHKAPNRIKIYQPRYDEELIIMPLQDDKLRLESVLLNTCECIKQKLFVPRETFLCNSCAGKNFCRHFHN